MRYCLPAVLFLFSTVNVSHAAIYSMTTDLHPIASTTKLEVYIGPPPPAGFFAFETIEIPTTGTVTFNDNAQVFSDPYVVLKQVILHLDDVLPTRVVLGTLGSFLFELTDIEIRMSNIYGQRFGNTFQIAPGGVQPFNAIVGIYGGTVKVSDPTGMLATWINGNFMVNYAQTPEVFYANSLTNLIEGSFDKGAGGATPYPELNIGNPTFPIDAELDKIGTLRIIEQLHFAAVPEISSFASSLLALGAIAGTAIFRRFGRGCKIDA